MKRLNLRDWVRLSNIRREISRNDNVPNNIFTAIALADTDTDYRRLPWHKVGEAFLSLVEHNEITIKFPILKSMKGEEGTEIPWDYPERDWYYWVHLLASNYGWSIAYISEMDIDDALALLQEIEVEAQMQKEWEYQLSEIAYPYDSNSKASIFKPMDRPTWMRREAKAQKRKILKKFVPIGYVIKVNTEDETPNSP